MKVLRRAQMSCMLVDVMSSEPLPSDINYASADASAGVATRNTWLPAE